MSPRGAEYATLVLVLVCIVATLAFLLVIDDSYVYVLAMLMVPAVSVVWLMRLAEQRYIRRSAASVGHDDSRVHWPQKDPGAGEGDGGPWPCGRWVGTARIWPVGGDEGMSVFPVRLVLKGCPLQAHLKPHHGANGRGGVVAVNVLEHDQPNGRLDLGVAVVENGRREEFVAQLAPRAGMLISEDETTTFTLELQPHSGKKRRRSILARRALQKRRASSARRSLNAPGDASP